MTREGSSVNKPMRPHHHGLVTSAFFVLCTTLARIGDAVIANDADGHVPRLS